MSKENIEIFVSVDGMELFCSAIASCAESISTLVSEMNAVESMSNSLDSILSATAETVKGKLVENVFDAGNAWIKYEESVAKVTAAQQGIESVMQFSAVASAVAAVATLTAGFVSLCVNTETATGEIATLCDQSDVLNKKMNTVSENLNKSSIEMEESFSLLNAKDAVAENIVTELYALEKASKNSGSRVEEMSVLVGQLDSMFPHLALEINKTTGELNKNEKQTRSMIETSLAYAKVQAAQESMIEIVKDLTAADMELYEAGIIYNEMKKEREALIERQNQLLQAQKESTDGVIESTAEYNGLMSEDNYELKEVNGNILALDEAMKQQKETITSLNEDYDAANEKYQAAYEYTQDLTDAQNGNTEALKSNTEEKSKALEQSALSIEMAGREIEAFNNMSTSQQQLATDLTNSVLTMQSNVQSALENQMNMFEQFDGGVQLSTTQLLENMHSQIEGVTQWEKNLSALADRGINQNLLQYLANMGPQGAGYVATFAEMTDEEFKEANAMWGHSVNMKEMTNVWGQELLASGAESIASSMDGVSDVMEASGADTVMGLVNGVIEAQKTAESVGQDLGVNLIDSINSGLGVASPYYKAKAAGGYVAEGLILGMENKVILVRTEALKLGNGAIDSLKSCDMYGQAYNVGVNFGNGMRDGILAKAKVIADEAARMVRRAINAANAEQNAHSPAKETIKVGHNFGDGAVIGIRDRIPDVEKASAQMAISMLNMVAGKKGHIRQAISATLDFSDLSGKPKSLNTSMQMGELRTLGDYIISGMKNVRLESYLDGKKISREFSRMGVTFGA